jgi:uncharacterized damage-inducible protein DinB
MTYSQAIVPEFEQEMANTRKVLERVPDDKLDWRPHPRSQTIGWNAMHLANLPSWTLFTLKAPSLDVAPPDGEPYRSPVLTSRSEILESFDRNVSQARAALEVVSDETMAEPWSLLQGGDTVFTMPRREVIRTFVLNHIIHHRAILCVYLRLNDVPVPGLYGPSGDESPSPV